MLVGIALLALAGTARAVPVPYRKSRAKAATARDDRGNEGDRSPAHDRHAKVTDLHDQSDDDQPPGHGADGTEFERRTECKDRITVSYGNGAREQCLDEPGCYLCIAPTTWSWSGSGNEFGVGAAQVKPRAKDRTVTIRHDSSGGRVRDSDFTARCKSKLPCGLDSEAWYAEGPKGVPVKGSATGFLRTWWQKAFLEVDVRARQVMKNWKKLMKEKKKAYRSIPEDVDETGLKIWRAAAKREYEGLKKQYEDAKADPKILRSRLLEHLRGDA